jgi:two-component system, NtrC family, response regulator AtoC
LLLRHFMALFATRYARAPLPVSPVLVNACRSYSWPGNLRELENFVKRYLILGDEQLALSELQTQEREVGADAGQAAGPPAKQESDDLKSLVRGLKDEAEREAIARTLERTRWNRKEAARRLGISYKALLYKIRRYSIDQS